MQIIEKVLSAERNSSLTVYLNAENNEFGEPQPRPFILVIPGGGYGDWSETEAEPAALAYMAAGYQAGILRYTLKDDGGWPHPLEDYENAMEMIRANAPDWLIDLGHIAVAGFSAGGHLAACAATLAKHKPNAAVLVYPSIVREECDSCQPGMPAPHEYVDGKTCPCFILAARDDVAVSLSNALTMASDLERAGVRFELHICSFGSHGFSTTLKNISGEVCSRLSDWVKDSVEWLGEIMGVLTIRGFTDPLFPRYLPADRSEYLSPECSLALICEQGGEAEELLSPLWEKMKSEAAYRAYSFAGWKLALEGYSLARVMEIHRLPPDQIAEIGEKLKKIKNIRLI